MPKEKMPQKQKLSEKDYEKKIIELAKANLTAEKLGEALRKEGIHPKEHHKKISKILKENSIYTNPDLKNIEKKLEKIKAHYEKNKQDKRAMREKDRVFAAVRKTKNYLKIPLK